MVSRLKYVDLHFFSPTCFQDLHGDNFADSSDKTASSVNETFIVGLKADDYDVLHFMCAEYARLS